MVVEASGVSLSRYVEVVKALRELGLYQPLDRARQIRIWLARHAARLGLGGDAVSKALEMIERSKNRLKKSGASSRVVAAAALCVAASMSVGMCSRLLGVSETSLRKAARLLVERRDGD